MIKRFVSWLIYYIRQILGVILCIGLTVVMCVVVLLETILAGLLSVISPKVTEVFVECCEAVSKVINE